MAPLEVLGPSRAEQRTFLKHCEEDDVVYLGRAEGAEQSVYTWIPRSLGFTDFGRLVKNWEANKEKTEFLREEGFFRTGKAVWAKVSVDFGEGTFSVGPLTFRLGDMRARRRAGRTAVEEADHFLDLAAELEKTRLRVGKPT